MTDRQTDRQTDFPVVDSIPFVEGDRVRINKINIARGTTDPWVETITGGTLQLANLVNINRWYHMHLFEIHPPGGVTCIRKKFGHQVAPLALVRNLAIRWRQLH